MSLQDSGKAVQLSYKKTNVILLEVVLSLCPRGIQYSRRNGYDLNRKQLRGAFTLFDLGHFKGHTVPLTACVCCSKRQMCLDETLQWQSVVLGGLPGTLALGAYFSWKPGISPHSLFRDSSEHSGDMTLGQCPTPAYGLYSPTFLCHTLSVEQVYGAPKGNQVGQVD